MTPRGVVQSRRFPASGAGPAPERLWLGSEGILGIVTQAWVRLRLQPTYRAATTVRFQDFFRAVEAVRAISQAGRSGQLPFDPRLPRWTGRLLYL